MVGHEASLFKAPFLGNIFAQKKHNGKGYVWVFLKDVCFPMMQSVPEVPPVWGGTLERKKKMEEEKKYIWKIGPGISVDSFLGRLYDESPVSFCRVDIKQSYGLRRIGPSISVDL